MSQETSEKNSLAYLYCLANELHAPPPAKKRGKKKKTQEKEEENENKEKEKREEKNEEEERKTVVRMLEQLRVESLDPLKRWLEGLYLGG